VKASKSKTYKDHFDLTSNSKWLEGVQTAKNLVNELQTVDQTKTRKLLYDLLYRTLYADGIQLTQTLIKSGPEPDAQKLKSIILDLSSKNNFEDKWIVEIQNLLEKNYPDKMQKIPGVYKRIFSHLGELFGKLNIDLKPIYNACPRTTLELLGYDVGNSYQDFENVFNSFKELYKQKVGKLSANQIPLNLEIDQFFNYFDKDEEAKKFLKETRKLSLAAVKANITRRCFIITQNPDSKYDDIEGKQHHYNSHVPNRKNFQDGVQVIVQSKDNNKVVFLGHAKIENITSKDTTDANGKPLTEFYAKFKNYIKFDPPKPRTEEILAKMKELPQYGNMPPSILPITPSLFKLITGQTIDDFEEMPQVKTIPMENYYALLKKKKQLIFYGPPGTGKTYTAKILAGFVTQKNSSTPTLTFREAAIKILKDEGKPMHYEEITKRALDQNLVQTKGETPEFTMLKEMSKEIQHLGDTATFTRTDKGTYGLNPNIDIELELHWNKNTGTNHKFIRSATFHQSYSYEEFIEGLRPQSINKQVVYNIEPGIFKMLCEEAKADPNNDYVLLIDEINRGNISKIFGELITLIENDKRGDVLQLAYSKEDFSVPENLYIIGTMNTADRSLVQIDAALRRRFAFCELMPKSELLDQKIEGISLRDLLDELNKRIVEAGLREKQIGHSYLLDIKDLENLQFVFANEIVPLLQDYFFDDYKKFEEDILSSDFIDSEKMIIKDDWKRDPGVFLESLKNTFQL